MQLGFSLFLIAIASLVVWSVVHKLSRSTVPAVGAPSGRPQSPAAFVAIGGRLSATAGDDFAWQLPQAA